MASNMEIPIHKKHASTYNVVFFNFRHKKTAESRVKITIDRMMQ